MASGGRKRIFAATENGGKDEHTHYKHQGRLAGDSIRNEMNLLGMLADAELKAIVKIEKLMKENANGNDTGD